MASQSIAQQTTPAEQLPALINPTRYTWFYFKIPSALDEAPTAAELTVRFTEMVDAFQERFFAESERQKFSIQLSDSTEFDTRRILLLERRVSGSFQVELELRQTLDVYVLAVNVEAPEEFAVHDLPAFPQLPFKSEPANHFLGSFTAFVAETRHENFGLQAVAAEAIGLSYLATERPTSVYHTGRGHLVFSEADRDTTALGAAFVCPLQRTQSTGESTDLTAAESLYLVDLPLLGLCHLKAVNSRRRLRSNLHPRLSAADVSLKSILAGSFERSGDSKPAKAAKLSIEKKLKSGNPSRLTLSELTEVSDELTNRRSGLTDQTEAVRRELHTIQINRENLAQLVGSWPCQDEVIDLLFESVVSNVVAQGESDLHYARSTLLRGEVFRDSLNASTTRREIKETRHVVMWMGVLGALSASALIPAVWGTQEFADLEFGMRLLLVAIPPAMFLGWLIYSWRQRSLARPG